MDINDLQTKLEHLKKLVKKNRHFDLSAIPPFEILIRKKMLLPHKFSVNHKHFHLINLDIYFRYSTFYNKKIFVSTEVSEKKTENFSECTNESVSVVSIKVSVTTTLTVTSV
jgi:hypothetical protein